MTNRMQLFAAGAAVAVVSVLGLTAFAAAPAKSAQADPSKAACFRVRDIDSVTVSEPHKANDGRRAVNIRLRNHDSYQLDTFGPCTELDDSIRVGVEAVNATGFICSGPEARVIANGTITGRNTCQVDKLHRLTPDELAAMPAKERP